jgi:hypothetical protein
MATMTDEREHDIRGQFAKETTDDDILTAMRESEFPAVTARWVAETLGIERPSAHRRLEAQQNQQSAIKLRGAE